MAQQRHFDHAAACALYEQGLNCRQIAEQLDVSVVGIWKVLKKNGVKTRRQNSGRQRQFDYDVAYSLHLDKLSFREIGEQLGVTGSGVHYALKRNGYIK